VRTDRQFDDAHVPGAICNPAVRAGFGTKLAWVAHPDQEVVFLGRDDEDAIHAAHLAAAVGIRRITGYLAGGMTSWREEKRPTQSVRRIDVAGLHELADHVQVLDVRERSEFENGHIPGSVHVPYHDVDGIPAGLDPARPIAVICASGQRSAVAASLLLRAGAADIIHVADGGVGTWARRGWPIERPEQSSVGAA
jgi:rhodanese-related sulfurtransferase